ncbi:arsenate reductase (glutaredoxin) [Bermanella sp. R86510]|uniref:arsenate reductase (glutaredoxin) n=1 Tax=unclassified Bermanella TaxID=2627862 RepID=UPI0037C67ED1
MAIQIWHNPRCSKSRQTLTLLQENGVEPNIYLYLDAQPSKADIKNVISKLGITPRELLRNTEDAYKELNLKDKTLSDAALINAMASHPKLIQRPIVINGEKAKLGRPPEDVLEII